MLKYLTKILLIYLMFLAFNACSHDFSVNYNPTESLVQIEGQHNDYHSDICSPMCNCMCCNTLVPVLHSYTLQISYNSSDFRPSLTNDLTPFIQNPASPPPKA